MKRAKTYVLVSGQQLQPSLMFVSKAGAGID